MFAQFLVNIQCIQWAHSWAMGYNRSEKINNYFGRRQKYGWRDSRDFWIQAVWRPCIFWKVD